MVNELCLVFKCKECPEQRSCYGCEHNYILIQADTGTNIYKCSKCGHKIRLNKDNPCCECIYKCKGEVTSVIDKDKGIYKVCNRFNNGEKE